MKVFTLSYYVYKIRIAIIIGLLPVILIFLSGQPAYVNVIVILSTVTFLFGQWSGIKGKNLPADSISLIGEIILITVAVIFTGWYTSPFLFLFLLSPITYALTAGLTWTYSIYFIFLPLLSIIMLAASIDKAWPWLVYTAMFGILFFIEVDIIHKWFHSSSEQIIKLKDKANRDPLTGLFNRYVIDDIYNIIEKNIYNDICSIVLFDLDDFKKKNDLYGHTAGDKILIKVAEILLDNIRNKDIILRYGGDEFLLILWDITSEEANLITSRIKQKVSLEAGCEISYGLVSGPVHDRADFKRLISMADEDLYMRKPKWSR